MISVADRLYVCHEPEERIKLPAHDKHTSGQCKNILTSLSIRHRVALVLHEYFVLVFLLTRAFLVSLT
jgi:hypothetical protein